MTYEEIEKHIIKYYEMKSGREIGKELKLKQSQYYGILTSLKLKGQISGITRKNGAKEIAEANYDDIVMLYKRGLSAKKIGNKFGIGEGTVYDILSANGIYRKNLNIEKLKQAEIKQDAMFDEGATNQDIFEYMQSIDDKIQIINDNLELLLKELGVIK